MSWYRTREVGSRLGVRITLGVMRTLGYGPARLLVACIAFYYALFAPGARRWIGDFHRRALGRSSFWLAYRTIRNFAESIMDRAFVLQGRGDLFRLVPHGDGPAFQLQAAGQGGLVLGAHLGVPEVTRGFFDRENFRVRMLMYEHSSMIYDEFRRVDPSLDRDLVRIEPGSVGYMLEVKDLVQRGEFLGILGDRPWMTGGTVRVPFLGADRDFPTGPYELACVLKCPILLMFMVKEGPREYHLHIEVLARPEELPDRADRRAGVEVLARRFAGRLEHHARAHPTQWYNFHDFWGVS